MKKSLDRENRVFIHPGDNVAVSLSDLDEGTEIQIDDEVVVLRDPIYFGHKFATRDIPAGEGIVKYGETIGVATVDIAAGDHVHVHNVRSLRGRAHG